MAIGEGGTMTFWSRLTPHAEVPLRVIPETELVEDIVAHLKVSPPANPLCFIVVKEGRPDVRMAIYSKWTSSEYDLSCYTTRELAEKMCNAPYEEVLAVGDAAELWAFLNNPRKGEQRGSYGGPPYGLRVDYEYHAPGYTRYTKAEVHRIAVTGLAKGFKKGRLKTGYPERVLFPVCMVCRKPVIAGISFHCISCDFTSDLHEGCRPGANLFGRAALTIGGGGLSCPKCGASS